MKKNTTSHIHFHQNMTDITHISHNSRKLRENAGYEYSWHRGPPPPLLPRQVRVQITVTNVYPCGMCWNALPARVVKFVVDGSFFFSFLTFFLFSFLLLRRTSVSTHLITLYSSMVRADENYSRLTVVEEIIWKREGGRKRERLVRTHTHTHARTHARTHTYTRTPTLYNNTWT